MLNRHGIFNQSPHNQTRSASKSVPLEGAGRFHRDRAQRAVPRLESAVPSSSSGPPRTLRSRSGCLGAVGRGLKSRASGLNWTTNGLRSSRRERPEVQRWWAGVRARPETASPLYGADSSPGCRSTTAPMKRVAPGHEALQVERGQQAAYTTGKNQTGAEVQEAVRNGRRPDGCEWHT